MLPWLIAHIRPTTPLRDPEIIEKAIIFFINNQKKNNLHESVHPMPESAYKTFEINTDGLLTHWEQRS